jgi:hypothetical protein
LLLTVSNLATRSPAASRRASSEIVGVLALPVLVRHVLATRGMKASRLVPGILILTAGCMVGEDPPLSLNIARTGHAQGTLVVAGETFSIESHIETKAPENDPSDALTAGTVLPEGDVRMTTLRDDAGDVIATWSVDEEDGDITGYVAQRPFGHVADSVTDEDGAGWDAVASGRASA